MRWLLTPNCFSRCGVENMIESTWARVSFLKTACAILCRPFEVHSISFKSSGSIGSINCMVTIAGRLPLHCFAARTASLQRAPTNLSGFGQHLEAKGYIARGGQMVDATIVPVPKQRNSRDENDDVKAGKTPDATARLVGLNRETVSNLALRVEV
jgi:hypothetical protein